jgi:hypothetical protein
VTAQTRRFGAILAILLLLLFGVTRPNHTGDVDEYALMTIGLAHHASADIRPADVELARALLPPFAPVWDVIADGLREGREVPKPGFIRDAQGDIRALHFWGYSALAALPLRVLDALGLPAFKCFQLVNLAMVFVLGLALLRQFGDARRAFAGVAAFLLCGGYLYGNWSSPEAMSAAALLAALSFACTGAPLVAGLLAGLASMQNPPIGLFCIFAPLLQLATGMPRREVLAPRNLLGMGLAAALCMLPVLYNLHHFGVPSLIAKVATSPELANLTRLHSLFFDVSQGMLVGVPALMAVVVFWCARRAPAPVALSILFTVALAAPALVTQNWNSAAAGMMRYAFWGAMPLLFVFLWSLRSLTRWPAVLMAALFLVQATALHIGQRYHNLEFNPIARALLERAPAWYNPEPEIFYERVAHAESYRVLTQVAVYRSRKGEVRKTLLHTSNTVAMTALCGPGRVLGPENSFTDAGMGWRYINGEVKCVAG